MTTNVPLTWLRTGALDFTYLVLGLTAGILTFTVVVTLFSTGLGLAITLVGIPILIGSLLVVRWLSAMERHRAAMVLGAPIDSPERRLEGSIWQRTKTLAGDPASWLGTLWSVLLLPIGIAGFTVAVTVWSTALGLLTSPAWNWAVDHSDAPDEIDFFTTTAVGSSALRSLLGLALVPVAYWTCRGLALGTAHLARLLLGERSEAPTQVLPGTPVAA